MLKRAVIPGFVSAFLLLLTLLAPFISSVAASPGVIVVPSPSYKIQDAINAASPGDTIRVASGTYYENVVVNKSLSLVGEDSCNTIIDGNGVGFVVKITADNVNFSGFTVRNGMKFDGGIWGLFEGIYLYQSSGSTVRGNVLSHNFAGISISRCDNILVSGNLITDNQYGINIISSSGNVIHDNIVTSNWLYGINLFASDNNTIVENEILYNQMTSDTYGIYIGSCSSGNILYHNNLVNNTIQAYENQTNTWDNGVEGNYWSDYNGTDVNGDGIGDTNLPHWDVDYRPLMEPWNPFRLYYVVWEGVTYCITALSNSTIASFNFSESLMQFGFSVIGPPGTGGFCNVTIPVGLLSGIFMVRVGGVRVDYFLTRNATHLFLYFNYGHGASKVEIYDVLGVLRKSWFKKLGDSGYDCRADLNSNGFVNVFDLAILGRWWHKCLVTLFAYPPPPPSPPEAKIGQSPLPYYVGVPISLWSESTGGWNGTHEVHLNNCTWTIKFSNGTVLPGYPVTMDCQTNPGCPITFTPPVNDVYTIILDVRTKPDEVLDALGCNYDNATETKEAIERAATFIDCFTNKMRRCGYEAYSVGFGPNMPADAYTFDELVTLYALVVYKNNPIQSRLVSFEVYSPLGLFLVGQNWTDANGVAFIKFRTPIPYDNATMYMGKWRCFQNVLLYDQYYNDTIMWDVGWVVHAQEVDVIAKRNDQWVPVDIVDMTEPFGVRISLKNIAMAPRDVLISITVLDDNLVPVVFYNFTKWIPGGLFCEPYHENHDVLNLTFPKWVYPGTFKVIVNAWFNGIPTESCCPPVEYTFVVTQGLPTPPYLDS